MGIEADRLTLFRSPEFKVKTYKGFDIQGFKSRTKSSEEFNCTQNSGVVVMMTTTSYASVHDNNQRGEVITYYGVIKDTLNYHSMRGARRSFCLSVIGLITTRTKQINMVSHLLTLQGQIRTLVPSFYPLWIASILRIGYIR